VNIISSKQTFFAKRLFPAIWLGGVSMGFVAGMLSLASRRTADSLQFLFIPGAMLVFGFFLFRKLVWDLADQVEDGGTYLLVRRGSIEQRVPLSNILNVSMSQFTNPRRLTLRLRTLCEFGDEIAFIPKNSVWQLNPFARNPIAEDLIRRVDHARNGMVRA
jgi:hypothetical protein